MMAESPSQSSPGTSGVNHPELSPGGDIAQKESALQIKDQMDDNNNDDDEDDYDDEEMDEDDNQRLSPLHSKIDKKPSALEEEEGEPDDEQDDYYDELIKRGQKLHTNVVVQKQDSKDKDFDEDFPLGTNEDQQSSIEEKVVLKPKEIQKAKIEESEDNYDEDDFHDDCEDEVDSSI